MHLYIKQSILLVIITLIGPQLVHAQAFLFDQLFQPSLRINTLYHNNLRKTTGENLHFSQTDFNLVVPIKSKLALDINLKKIFNRREKLARLKAYQLFWNIRPSIYHVKHKALDAPVVSYGLSTGLTGVHLILRKITKPKILFNTLNFSYQESVQNLRLQKWPSVQAVTAIAVPKSLNTFWFYGLYLSASPSGVLPAPILGYQTKLARRQWLQVLLPVQISYSLKVHKKLKFDLVSGLGGNSINYGDSAYRNNLSVLHWRNSFVANIKVNSNVLLSLEGAWAPIQQNTIQHKGGENTFLRSSSYLAARLFCTFKKSLLGSSVDGIIIF